MATKGFFRPFKVLARKFPKEELPVERPLKDQGPLEEILRDVKPLKKKQKIFWTLTTKEALSRPPERIPLEELFKIRVQDTPEYVEELVRGFQKNLFAALHQGYISISRVLNLHRLRVHEAEEIFHSFMKDCLHRGDHCVLIIHGRGLSSKGEPILKHNVQEWLKYGPDRKYVIGFCSARQCDGGTGATYVLLSSRPLKRSKK